jgi:hypothetical protein
MADRNDLEFQPYPYPPKKGLLLLLGLPEDASKETYEGAWRAAMIHGMRTSNAGPEYNPADEFQTAVRRMMVQTNRTYDEAFASFSASAEGKQILARQEQFSRSRSGRVA